MLALSRFITRRPLAILITVLSLTILFALGARKVTMTTDIRDFFPRDHPEVKAYDAIADAFGGTEYIMVATEGEDVFQQESLALIQSLTERLAAIPGVDRVRSLTNVEEVKGTAWGIELSLLLDALPQDEEEAARLRRRVLEDDFYAGSVVSRDGRLSLLALELDPQENAVEVAAKVLEAIDEDGVYATGTPVLNSLLAKSMKEDLIRLIPLVVLLIALVLYLYFHNLWGVLLPFLTVIISTIWTLGAMGLSGRQMTPLNSVMPVILITLGNAYGIHILSRFDDEASRGQRDRAVEQTLLAVGRAVLMAGTTTIAGFLSNCTSSIVQMREFGFFTAFGIAVALGISLIFIPAVLSCVQVPSKEASRESGALPNILRRVARLTAASPGKVIIVTLLAAGILALGAPRLTTNSNLFSFFDYDTEPRMAYELVKKSFSGSESLELVVEGDILEPKVLRSIESLQDELEATGLTGKPISIVDVLKRVNMALNDGDPAYKAIPASRELAAQYLLLLEMSDPDFLTRFITVDYSQARIQAMVKDTSPAGLANLFAQVDALTADHRGKIATTGMVKLLDALAAMIIRGQITSLILGLIAVFLLVRWLTDSWEGSLLSTLLIALSTAATFGFMGWMGIALDMVTVLISSIGIGVGVDYSVHLYSGYQEARTKGKEPADAVTAAICQRGKAIIGNAAAVIGGFLIFLFSSFPPLRYFGSLVSFTMFFAASLSLTLLPALIAAGHRMRPRTEETDQQTNC
ncbi:MAG: efflux RND transporter permease subunit [Limnochordia bacterium]|jgi:hydrophobe/amphiphile efflux-3 (HAE3) family protein|nr:RND family transporter [Bacillota bacterium]